MSDRVEAIRRWVDATIPNEHSGLCTELGCYWCSARHLLSELDAERARADALASAACELFNREDLVNGYALVTATRAILEARKAIPCVSPKRTSAPEKE